MDKITEDTAQGELQIIDTATAAAFQPLPTITSPDQSDSASTITKPIGKPSAWALLLFIGAIWGATFSLAKIVASGGGHPLGMNYWQSLIGAGLLLILCAITKNRIPLNRKTITFFAACSLLGSVVPGVIYFYAAARVSAGVLSITIASVPLITFIMAALLGVEKFRILRVMGVIFGIVSIVMLVAPKESLPDPTVVPWIFAALFAALCYSAENIYVALRMPKGMNTLTAITGLFVMAALIMTPMVIVLDAFVPLIFPFSQIEWAVVGMATISVTAYGLYIFLIVRTGPVFASQTAYMVTFSGVFWGIIIFGEQHSSWIWASLASMILALALVTPRENSDAG